MLPVSAVSHSSSSGSAGTLHGVFSLLDGGLNHAVSDMTQTVFVHTIFSPFQLPGAAVQVFSFSRNLAVAASALFFVWAVVQVQWPELRAGSFISSPAVTVHRALSQALWAVAAVPLVQMLLSLNNAVVSAFEVQAVPAAGTGTPLGLLTDPIVDLAVMAAVLLLTGILGIYYGVRTLEIVVLMALIPWFGLVWMAHPGNTALQKLVKELIVAIFIQSLHAMMFYFFLHLVQEQGGTVSGQLEEIGLLWYMLKLPQQLRRIVGATGPGGPV